MVLVRLRVRKVLCGWFICFGVADDPQLLVLGVYGRKTFIRGMPATIERD